MRCGLNMGRSALPMRRPTCYEGPARAAAHHMSCTTATTNTTFILPMRQSTGFHAPARVAAHGMWCVLLLLLLLRRQPAPTRRPTGFHGPSQLVEPNSVGVDYVCLGSIYSWARSKWTMETKNTHTHSRMKNNLKKHESTYQVCVTF